MEKKTWDIHSLLDDNLDIAEQTLNQIKKQGEQINSSDESISNIEYLSKQGEKLLDRMSSFFYRLYYKPEEVNFRDVAPREEGFEEIKWENNTFNEKLLKLKEIGLEIGENLDKHNKELEELGVKVDNNSSNMKNNIKKIKKIMG